MAKNNKKPSDQMKRHKDNSAENSGTTPLVRPQPQNSISTKDSLQESIAAKKELEQSLNPEIREYLQRSPEKSTRYGPSQDKNRWGAHGARRKPGFNWTRIYK